MKFQYLPYMGKNIKSSYNNNKLKLSATTQNDKFKLPDRSYPVPDIQDCSKSTLEKHRENIDNPSVTTYVNETINSITFKIKTGHYLELLIPETMNLLGNTENKVHKDKNGEKVPHLEITEVVLVHCNFVNNDYQQDSRVLYIIVPNKPLGGLLEISPENHVF